MRNLAIIAAAALMLPAAASAQIRPAPRPAAPAVAPRPAPAPQQSQIPAAAGLIVLIKSSMIALNQANLTGNYQVLYALGSDTLRQTTNPQNLALSFAPFRQRGVDLSPVIYLNPQLARTPTIEQGRLHIVGSFPTSPLQITFDFWFEPSQGQWKFVQLNTNLVPVAQAPAAQGQQQRPQPQQRKP
jgi:hypothetical protein